MSQRLLFGNNLLVTIRDSHYNKTTITTMIIHKRGFETVNEELTGIATHIEDINPTQLYTAVYYQL